MTQGTQKWEGRILAKSTVAGDDIDVDYLMFVPADEGSGVASGVTRNAATPTSYTARDDFTGTTSGNALNGRTAPVGGTWATSGDATDFAFADLPVATDETLLRTAASGTNGRFAILGSATPTDVAVSVDVNNTLLSFPTVCHLGVIARWTDSSNYVRCVLRRAGSGSPKNQVQIVQRLAGTDTTLAFVALPSSISDGTWYTVRLTVYANGRAVGELLSAAGAVIGSCEGTSTDLATGGTLASGKSGIFDLKTSAGADTRYYDNLLVSTPTSDAAIYASQSLEVRHDRVTREDSAGGVWTAVSSYVGDYLRVPPAGQEGRTARVIVKASRNDPFAVSDPAIDDISARLFVVPRYLVVPS